MLVGYTGPGGDLIIPDDLDITSIGAKVFEGMPNTLESVTIPNGVVLIGNTAFMDCKILTSVTIPNSVKEIGYWAFNGCGSLAPITTFQTVSKK